MAAETVHRNLRLTSPLVTGPDVRALQHAVNRRLRRQKLRARIHEDGELGPQTLTFSRIVAYNRGCSGWQLNHLKNSSIRKSTQRLIRRDTRDAAQISRARARRGHLLALRRQLNNRSGKAVRWAKGQTGTTESPANSNRGPAISKWQREFGTDGQPWCGAFVGYAVKKVAGVRGITSRILYVPYIIADARAGRNGLRKFVAPRYARAGDLVCMDFGGSADTGEHVGMCVQRKANSLICIEGNTSSGTSGSQSNGGMVAMRERPFSVIVGCARPRW